MRVKLADFYSEVERVLASSNLPGDWYTRVLNALEAGGGGGGGEYTGPIKTDAPQDGKYYARRNGAWVLQPQVKEPFVSPLTANVNTIQMPELPVVITLIMILFDNQTNLKLLQSSDWSRNGTTITLLTYTPVEGDVIRIHYTA